MIIFIIGTIQIDLFGIGYIAFSLFLITKSELLIQKKNKIWKWIRIYNYLLILMQVFFIL